MSTRAIRRAAERQALKDARKAAVATAAAGCSESETSSSLSDARLAANHANAQLSTGPKTEEGKAKSRLNAVKTGLTGRTVLLPIDDVEIYQKHVQEFVDQYQPVGPRESELVQALADHAWRLDRVAVLEHALYAHGHEEFSEQFADRGPLQAGFTQMHTFLVYEKQFRNLQTQEMRLRRNREKDTAELRRMQSERLEKERLRAKPSAAAKPSNIGFEFSEPEIDERNGTACVSDSDVLASFLHCRTEVAGQPSATEL
ncbi:MAG: hypothetical protein WA324_16605 [Bryobacteraceae bacterium]